MKNLPNNSIYDLIVIGNGVAAQTFLWNLQGEDRFSQNFSIAHIYAEHLTPACSLRTSATVSLNGINEDVSPLGNDMRAAYFLFEEMVKKHSPKGVEQVTRVVVSTNDNDTKKLTRRYKTLDTITSDRLKLTYPGVTYPAFVISPNIFSDWLTKEVTLDKTTIFKFVKNLEKKTDCYLLTLEDGQSVKGKKIVFATGAYSKIFEKFYSIKEESIEEKNMVKAGSYLERQIDLGEKSFYLLIDDNKVLYRKNAIESTLIIGSATTVGAYEVPDLIALEKIIKKLKNLLTFDIGELKDFKITTGLRHKGPKRMLICETIDEDHSLFRINGLYKNGFTMSLLAAERMRKLI